MSLIKWEPFSFRPFFDFPSPFRDEGWWGTQGLDIYETDSTITVEAAVPGVQTNEVTISIDHDLLTINAEHREEKEEKGKDKKAVYQASRQRSFQYVTTLPKAVDESKATAKIENGVLKVTLPKTTQEKKAKSIKVEGAEVKG